MPVKQEAVQRADREVQLVRPCACSGGADDGDGIGAASYGCGLLEGRDGAEGRRAAGGSECDADAFGQVAGRKGDRLLAAVVVLDGQRNYIGTIGTINGDVADTVDNKRFRGVGLGTSVVGTSVIGAAVVRSSGIAFTTGAKYERGGE